jgi:tripartite-type tricarboxylate transporter receptor subunit TctC
VKSLGELIALARKEPGRLYFSATSPGSSSNLTAELFKRKAGIDIVHVPHKTMGNALVDVLSGQVQLCMSAGPNAVAHIKSGKLRGLAASTPKRSMVLPDVPTFTELGFPDVALPAWYGILARAGTPAPIVSRLSAEIGKAVGKPQVRERLLNAAVEPAANTPEQYAAFIASDLAKWGEAANAAELNLKTFKQRR